MNLISRRPHLSLQANSCCSNSPLRILEGQHSCSAQMSNLLYCWQVWRRTAHLVSCFSRGSVACLAGLSKRVALHATCSRIHLYGHSCLFVRECVSMAILVCAHSPTVLTNSEPCRLVAECMFYACQAMTQTINRFCPSEKYFHI